MPMPLPAPDGQPDAPQTPRLSDAFVQSFARGLAVLRSFDAQSPAQTMTGAARRSGLTRAGARRMLLRLQQLGYIKSEGRLFTLTPRAMELGSPISARSQSGTLRSG